MPEIQMPKLSDTMTEGTLVAWKKKKGDKVSAGEVIAEIETDKATMEWESPEDGTLTEIYVEEGGKVDVGQRIAFIGEEGEAAPKEDKKAPEKKEKKEEPPKKEAKKPEEPKKEQAETEKPASAKAQETETAPPREKGKPVEAAVSPASEFREKKAEPERPSRPPRQESEARVKASPVARRMAAVKVPRVNAPFDNDAIVQYADVDLGIAVAIEDGLLTPVIRAAQDKSLREISELAKDLANRARNKRMKPEEFQGGSFTVSNLGGMGIDSFSAIINPPQGFILAVGKINKMPVIDNCDQVVVGHRMSIWMSCDHRVIDGALGAVYLKELRHLLENPALLLV